MQRQFYDQLHRPVTINFPPQRIISLVPSQTELLYDLGLDSQIAGITKFCVHPNQWHQTKIRVGGTKNFAFDIIDSLNPDLIIANKEENYLEGVNHLQQKYPVWVSDIQTIEEALKMITDIGELTGKTERATEMASGIQNAFTKIKPHKPLTTLYLIWKGPWMAAGKDTFIDTMLSQIGLINAVDATRYPELTDSTIRELNPQVVMLSSEPFPFAEKHLAEMQSLLPSAKIMLVDGEMFSWYGSRLLKAPSYFSGLAI